MQRRPSIFKRLLPLYLGVFLQGLVFWYAIEKLFMTKIGFDSQTIGISVAIYCAAALITEIPAGILADRWSRKGVLVLSSLALIASTLIGAISNDVSVYLFSSAVWGVFIALTSGIIESTIYDTLLEEHGSADKYENEVGKLEIFNSIALIIGAITGGIIGQFIGLRETYWLTIPAILLSIIFFLQIKEPELHQQNQNESLLEHTRLTLGSVFRNINLIWVLITLIATSIVWTVIMEMWQVWLIALIAPAIIFGPAGALVQSSFGLGGILSKFLKSKRNIFIGTIVTFICLITLIFSRNIWIIIFSIFLLMLIIYGINIVLTHRLHDNLPSQVRAGSASVINAIKRLLVIPMSIIFGTLAHQYGIFTAEWLLVAIFIIAIISQIFIKNADNIKIKNV